MPLIANRPIRLTAPDLLDYERQNHTFEGVGGWRARTFELSGGRESERVQAVRATAAFFSVLEVPPALGRSFTPEEDDEAAAVCVISDGLWQRWFGADRHAIGETIHLDRLPYRVIGVMPRGFEFPLRGNDTAETTDVWVPMSLTPSERQARGDNWSYNGIARMKPGVTVAQASADVNVIAQQIVRNLPPDQSGILTFRAVAQPLGEQLSRTVRPLLLALAGRRRVRPADCVRQRRQPPAGAWRPPGEGGRGSRRARRQPQPHRAATRGGNTRARGDGRGTRRSVGALDHRRR